MKKVMLFTITFFLGFACGNPGESTGEGTSSTGKSAATEVPQDDGKGIGEVKSVSLNDPLDAAMVQSGKQIYEMKCAACHKLTDQRVVGPGWKGLTEKRKPEWIMNMVLNVEVMLEKDSVARELLKECLVKMPNQNLSREDARDVLEFIYANDGYKIAGQ